MASAGLKDAVEEVSSTWSGFDRPMTTAVGVACDLPEDPGVLAVVYQGRLVRLCIAKAYMSYPARVLEPVINGVILAAFTDWREQVVGGVR